MTLKVNVGDEFECFTIVHEVEQRYGKRYFLCKCYCGNEKVVQLTNLRQGGVRTCGTCFNGKKLTQSLLRKAVWYCAHTGLFWRKHSVVKKHVGNEVGHVNAQGYITFSIGNKRHLAHRLAWLYTHGYMPENEIDHKNREKTDNRIVNLREVSRQCNARNIGASVLNKSGVKGVVWYDRKNKWIVSICSNGKNKHLGYYKDFTNAVAARLAGEQCLNWSGCDTSSPALLHMQEHLTRI